MSDLEWVHVDGHCYIKLSSLQNFITNTSPHAYWWTGEKCLDQLHSELEKVATISSKKVEIPNS